MRDNYREGLTFLKILQLFRLFLPKNTRTLARLDKFTEFNPDKIFREKKIRVKGIILDADDTIAINRGRILPENLRHLKKLLQQGIKIVLYSNMRYTNRYKVLPKEIKILSNLPAKPNPTGFKIALRHLKVPRKNVAVIGDNYITDGGAIRAGLPFIKVNPIPKSNKSPVEKAYSSLRNFYDWISRFHERL